MRRKGCAGVGAVVVAMAILAHILLSTLPNRDDAAADALREAGGEVRRTPRFLWLAVMTDVPDAFYPRGDVWSIDLRDAEVGPGVADHLPTLRSLQFLDLDRCRIPAGVSTNLVPPSGELRGVSVRDTNIADCHLSRLGDCPNLIHLILDGTDVTDASVPTITRCRSLGYVVLRRSKVTPGGVAAIRKALPRANVVAE
jgi:hypothetical protein